MSKHNNNNNNKMDTSHPDDWICIICSETMSSTRFPVLNTDNCGSAERARFADGQGGYYTLPSLLPQSPYDQTVQQFQPLAHHVPESNISSNTNDTVRPEAIAKLEPSLQPLQESNEIIASEALVDADENHFIPVGPEPGNNELEAQISSSFHHNEYPPQLQHYLTSPDYFFYSHTSHSGIYSFSCDRSDAANSFLEQGMQSMSMMVQDESSRRSRTSGEASEGGNGGERSWWNGMRSVALEGQVAGAGGWMDGDGDFFEGGDSESMDEE